MSAWSPLVASFPPPKDWLEHYRRNRRPPYRIRYWERQILAAHKRIEDLYGASRGGPAGTEAQHLADQVRGFQLLSAIHLRPEPG